MRNAALHFGWLDPPRSEMSGQSNAIVNARARDRKRRKKLKNRLRAEGCSEELIERIVAWERQKDLVRRHGSVDGARRARAKSAKRTPDDTGYEPSVGDPLLRGAGRATGIAAKVVGRRETITKWQYHRLSGED